MNTQAYAAAIVQELQRTLSAVSEAETEPLIDAILRAQKVFVAGAGRSGLMSRSFAMRLMHTGVRAYVVGESVTPSLCQSDLLVIASGSGETKSLVSMAEKAKSLDAAVAAVTISPQSTIGRLADLTVQIPAKAKYDTDGENKSIQPMGSLFEQTLLVLYDAIILRLMDREGIAAETLVGRHANLE